MYDIVSSNGDIQGEFTNTVLKADNFVKKYEGVTTTATFKFITDDDKEVADPFVLNNREGQQYFTPEIPSVSGYALDLDALPSNGAGTLKGEKMEIVYKYKPVTDADDATCRVNAIYMNDDGKIIETKNNSN